MGIPSYSQSTAPLEPFNVNSRHILALEPTILISLDSDGRSAGAMPMWAFYSDRDGSMTQNSCPKIVKAIFGPRYMRENHRTPAVVPFPASSALSSS